MNNSNAIPLAILIVASLTIIGLPVGALDAHIEPDLPSVDAATAVPTWAALSTATIQPGVQMITSGSQCTSNFVYYRQTGSNPPTFDIYLGYAAHCAGLGAATSTNGCTTGSRAVGTPVTIQGASRQGTLAYSSWKAMQQSGAPTPPGACAYNDFALVKVHPNDHSRINPSVRHFGGPTGLCAGPTSLGAEVISYGNSGLRFGLRAAAPKTGINLFRDSTGWSNQVYVASPGIPGDSGSGYMDDDHCAWGVTSTVQLFPYAGSNGIGSISKALAYASANGGPSVTIATATPITSLIV